MRPMCNGPIAWKDFDAVQRDIDNLKAAAGNAEEVFMTAVSPGQVALPGQQPTSPTRSTCGRSPTSSKTSTRRSPTLASRYSSIARTWDPAGMGSSGH